MRDVGTPIRWSFYGDKFRAQSYVNIARKLLAILKTRLAMGVNLGTDTRTHHIGDGTIIKVNTWEGRDAVGIFSPVIAPVPAKPKPEEDLLYFPFLWIGTRIASNVNCSWTYQQGDPLETFTASVFPETHPYLWEPYIKEDNLPKDKEHPLQLLCAEYHLHRPWGEDGSQLDLGETMSALTPPENHFPGAPPGQESISVERWPIQSIPASHQHVSWGWSGGVFYTESGAWLTTGANTYDPRAFDGENIYAPGKVKDADLWETSMVIDPTNSKPYDFDGYNAAWKRGDGPQPAIPAVSPGPHDPEGSGLYLASNPPTAEFGPFETWVKSGVYVFKLSTSADQCGNCEGTPVPLTKDYVPASQVEVEVRLGQGPGIRRQFRYHFDINTYQSIEKGYVPYGESLDTASGALGPTSHDGGNWWSHALLIDVKQGRVTLKKNYFLEDTEDFNVEGYHPFPGGSAVSFECSE